MRLRHATPHDSSRGATAIRIEFAPVAFANAFRAASVSLGILGCAAFGMSAAAQTSAHQTSAQATKPSAQTTSKPATSRQTTGKQTTKPDAKPTITAPSRKPDPALDQLDLAERVSNEVIDVAAWIISTGDNRGLPFAIVDKRAAQILIFNADGKVRGLAPALIGSAVGDESAEGVADRELKDIPMDERTTPAGRFLAAFGPAVGGKSVLWVDYATAISIHPLEATAATKKERRKERLASATPRDNRITHGCINVSPQFFAKIVRPAFTDSGVFYILPDSSALGTAFPAFVPPQRYVSARNESGR